ncbi:MAG: mechanosensitive ion channel domain-containing protein [Methanomassiliicoccales archaeon]|jgi:small-conductance mechanosensitive channel
MALSTETNKKMAWLVALPFIILLVLAAVAPTIQASGVNVFDVDNKNYTRNIDAAEDATFEWVVFNNDSSPFLLKVNVTGVDTGSIKPVFEQNFTAINAGDAPTVKLTMIPDRDLVTTDVAFQVIFTFTQMNDPTQTITITKQVSMHVDSTYGAKAGQNKIFGVWQNNLPSPFESNYGAFVVTVLGWIAIALIVMFGVDPLIHYATRKTETNLDDIMLKILRYPVFIFIVTYGFVVNSLEILNLPRNYVKMIETVYSMMIIILIAYVAYKIFDEVVLYYAKEFSKKTDTEIDDVIVPVVEKLGMVLIPVLALIAIFNMFGYDVTVLLAGVGFLGIVIGFAAQSTLANFFAGLQMLVDRPFKIGDLLKIEGGDICEVSRIGMRSTTLYNTFTHEEVIIPNDQIANNKIVNMVEPDRKLIITVKVGVAYGSDVEQVKRILLEEAAKHPNVLNTADHKTVVRFSDFEDSDLLFKIFLWVDDVKNQFKVGSDFREAILREFNKVGIEIPFPQSVVWLHEANEAVKKE